MIYTDNATAVFVPQLDIGHHTTPAMQEILLILIKACRCHISYCTSTVLPHGVDKVKVAH